MGARSTGLAPRRGYLIDAATVLVGAVAAGARGRAAGTRTGAAQILNTRLEAQDTFKLVAHGNASAAGQYTVQVAHVPEGGTVNNSHYATIALVTCAPGIQEIALSGAQVRAGLPPAPRSPRVTCAWWRSAPTLAPMPTPLPA
jgi:hypothetical protein